MKFDHLVTALIKALRVPGDDAETGITFGFSRVHYLAARGQGIAHVDVLGKFTLIYA